MFQSNSLFKNIANMHITMDPRHRISRKLMPCDHRPLLMSCFACTTAVYITVTYLQNPD